MKPTYSKEEFSDFYNQIGIELGRLCNARCEHCISLSGPKNKAVMSPETIRRIIRESASVGINHLELTGGEPFLFINELEEIVRYATSYGMITGMTTNSYWASKPEKAEAILARMKDAGLVRLRFSIDQYHLNYIPIERLETAVRAAVKVGLGALIEATVGRKDYRAYDAVKRLRALHVELRVSELLPFGKAADLPPETFLSHSFFEVSHSPCGSAGVPIVETDGRLLLCCSYPVAQDSDDLESPFVLGHIEQESVATILARHLYNPLLRVLRYEGPGGLLRVLEEKYGNKQYKPRPSYPGRICLLCADMMEHINLKRLWHETVREHDMTAWFTPPVAIDEGAGSDAGALQAGRTLPVLGADAGVCH